MAEYSRLAKGKFTSTGKAQIVTLPFVPDFVELINYTAAATPTNHGIPFAKWDVNMVESGNNPTVVEIFNATPVLTTGRVLTNGISTFQAGLLLQYGPVYQHTGSTDFSITAGTNPTTVTTTSAHNLATGDVVIFSNLYQTSTTGMQQIAGIPFMVTVTGSTTFTIAWDTSSYTTFNSATSTNNVGSFKKVLYPNLYFPGVDFISAITTGTTTTIQTTTQHNFQVGQEVAFRIPSQWGTIQLNSLPNSVIPGSPKYGYVISITDLQTFVVNLNSVGFTAFTVAQAFANFRESFPQVLAVGDVNTGGVQISSGSPLYPSPKFSYATLNDSSTINGPAILGSYVNNTYQGFVVGAGNAKVGAAAADASSFLVGNSNDLILWRAFLHDLSQ
jgi:Ubiquitin-activating enzyme E1 FCCH domain